jgi:hypothetical protein
LYFINKEVKLLVLALHSFSHICRKLQGIAISNVPCKVKLNGDDLVFPNALGQKMIPKQSVQQIGLAASVDAGYNLDMTIPLLGKQSFQVSVSFDFHKANLLVDNFSP